MKKSYFYLLILVAIITACNNLKSKSSNETEVFTASSDTLLIVSDDTLDAKRKLKEEKLPEDIYHFETEKQDTIIGDYYISYTIKDNAEIIATYPVVADKGLDTAYYAGREVELNIKCKDTTLLHKQIDKKTFASYIPIEESEKMTIYYFRLEKVNDEKKEITFSINICIPDTDICYSFEINIMNGKDMEIKEVISEEEEW
ncbi:DUF4738 domain-containing protein [Bacteroides sp.]|uniref:DUF4738 domain-containing protein n=1 Tax=Bacteroides sp. TaxID=29523 RepID=UPI00261D7B89|nr:DUF4738 domain-containing protein [Bacteroides sp.]MDD3037132.1 DUF4738 domain-containing protein [Bacteroides sp.]